VARARGKPSAEPSSRTRAPRLTRATLAEGVGVLSRRDPALGRWMRAIGPVTLRRSPSQFGALCRSVIAQQVSAGAARTIHARLCACFAPARGPDPARLLALDEAELRACGLSRQKIRYLRAIAEAYHRGALRGARLGCCPDEEVVHRLTRLPGVGPWTAEMFLIFSLGRPDVFTVRDLALCNGVRRLRGRALEPARIERVAARWSPWRSVASLYLWRIAHWRGDEPA